LREKVEGKGFDKLSPNGFAEGRTDCGGLSGRAQVGGELEDHILLDALDRLLMDLEPLREPVDQLADEHLGGRGAGGDAERADAVEPAEIDVDLLDGVITVDAEDSREMARRSAREEGILVGISSGACLTAIAQKLPELPKGSRILGFNYDTGERYLSVPDFLPEQ